MKELFGKVVAVYVAIGEIPTLWAFLVFVAKGIGNAEDPQTEAVGELMVAVTQNAVIPWWIQPLERLSPYPILLVGFSVCMARFGGFDF